MDDVTDEFCKPEIILSKFHVWRKTDMNSYKDAFVSLCLPKVYHSSISKLTSITNKYFLIDFGAFNTFGNAHLVTLVG